MAVRVAEICKISPPSESATESSLPLTFFDTHWIKFHPGESIFFYELATDSSSFFSSILPKLKQSLSLTLLHFLPFSGKLVWPSHSDKPFILYTPGDGVSLTVAESDADFDILSGDTIREIPDSHHYLPELYVSESEAETMTFQITFFPNKGFCIGSSSHHAIFDGKSIILLIKCWAYVCTQTQKDNRSPTLPPELAPNLDRTVIKDSEGLDLVYLNHWITVATKTGMDTNPKSLKLFSWYRSTKDTNFVRGTFILSSEDINNLRQKVLSSQTVANQANSKRFSTYALAFAYTAITTVKAKRLESTKKLILICVADVRARLDPPLHHNYFGNCVNSKFLQTTVASAIKEDGLAFLVEELTQMVKKFEEGALDGAKEKFKIFEEMEPKSTEFIGVAGSPRFGIYDADFGWGKPRKVEITSVDRDETIAMMERRDGSRGVEIGIVLEKEDMKMFQSLFLQGLKELCM